MAVTIKLKNAKLDIRRYPSSLLKYERIYPQDIVKIVIKKPPVIE